MNHVTVKKLDAVLLHDAHAPGTDDHGTAAHAHRGDAALARIEPASAPRLHEGDEGPPEGLECLVQ